MFSELFWSVHSGFCFVHAVGWDGKARTDPHDFTGGFKICMISVLNVLFTAKNFICVYKYIKIIIYNNI